MPGVDVRYAGRLVGRLVEQRGRALFQYDRAFATSGLELSPFKLPLSTDTFDVGLREFAGLPGLFFDSLPDGWGLLLMNRSLEAKGIDPSTVNSLGRLRMLGERAMGALTYHPPEEDRPRALEVALDQLHGESLKVYEGKSSRVLEALRIAGGSPAGARPKVLVAVGPRDQLLAGIDELPKGFKPWLIKFAAKSQPLDHGALEEAWAEMARRAGVRLPSTKLFELKDGTQCFGCERFDYDAHGRRVHMHSACGLLHANFRMPSLDYRALLQLTRALTQQQPEVIEMTRRMVFNVLTSVRDDHSKNFSFLMDEHGDWTLSPAYDLCFNRGPGQEHSTSIRGEARNPTWNDLWALSSDEGVSAAAFREIAERTLDAAAQLPAIGKRLRAPAALLKGLVARLREIHTHLGDEPWRPKSSAKRRTGRQTAAGRKAKPR